MPKLSSKNQITIPVEALREAGIEPGDEVRVVARGHGRVEIERMEDVLDRYAGSLNGLWQPGELSALRDEWEH